MKNACVVGYGAIGPNHANAIEQTDMGKGYWGKGHAGLIKDFYDRGVYFSPLDVKPTMDCVFAMYDSARVGGKELFL